MTNTKTKILAISMAIIAALIIAYTLVIPTVMLVMGESTSGQSYPIYDTLVILTYASAIASIFASFFLFRAPQKVGIVYIITYIIFLLDSFFLYQINPNVSLLSGFLLLQAIILPMIMTYLTVGALLLGSYLIGSKNENSKS